MDLTVILMANEQVIYDENYCEENQHDTQDNEHCFRCVYFGYIGHLLGGICKISRMVMGSPYVFISGACDHLILFALNGTCLLASMSALPHQRGR